MGLFLPSQSQNFVTFYLITIEPSLNTVMFLTVVLMENETHQPVLHVLYSQAMKH